MGRGSLRLGGPATGGMIMLDHVQPLVTKCRVEPTRLFRGKSISRITASSNGTVELVLALFGEEVEQAACVEFAVTLTSESPEGQFTKAVCSQ